MNVMIYGCTRVASSRTHDDTIDIELTDHNGSKVRAFLGDELAKELVIAILTAVNTPTITYPKEENIL